MCNKLINILGITKESIQKVCSSTGLSQEDIIELQESLMSSLRGNIKEVLNTEDKDPKKYIRFGHTIKGVGAQLGIGKIRKIGVLMEKAGKENNLETWHEHLDKLKDLINEWEKIKD